MAGLEGSVVITGGAGFLGRGILRRAKAEGWKARFTIYSRDEFKQHQCRDKYPDAEYVIGDICDERRLEPLLAGKDVLIAAAALKYVPQCELNVHEAVRVNVDGTRILLQAAVRAGVRAVVLVSTDKACSPWNTYGLTKSLMERLAGEVASWVEGSGLKTKITLCRYGNIVGSSGSVVPVFQKQFAETGQVTVTDPAMTRFWMGVDQGIDLITYAANLGRAGHIYIPRSIQSMTLAGLVAAIVPDGIVKIIGVRPGEKRHEALLAPDEAVWTWPVDGYYALPTPFFRKDVVREVESFTSADSPRMSAEDFRAYVEDAAHV